MRLNFRQGIVSHDISGVLQSFLSQPVANGDVSILTTNKPVLVTLAHKSTNYLISESNDVVAWPGPFTVGTDYYLYWELDSSTAQRTFGSTTLPPIAQATAPIAALDDQHWFDTTNNQMFVRNGLVWIEVIRVFACLLKNGNAFISMGADFLPAFTGTQIGDHTSNLSGRIVFDQTNNPIARRDLPGTFFTTEDPLFVNAALVNNVRLESNVNYAKSSQAGALAAFNIVAYQSDGTIKSAVYEDTGSTVLGIVSENLLLNETGAITIQGVVTNPSWSWTTVGVPLWVDSGALVEIDPATNSILHPISQVPAARVLSSDTVVFEQGLGGKGEQGPPGSIENIIPATTSVLGGVALSTNPVLSAFPIAASDTDPRLSDARTPLPHTHISADITFTPAGGVISNNVQSAIAELGNGKVDIAGDTMTGILTLSANPTSSLHAATKSYVDAFVSGLIWLTPIDGFINLIDDSLNTPPGSPKESDVYIVGPTPIGVWTGLANTIVLWDGAIWQNMGLLSSFAVGTRFGIAIESVATPGGTFAGKNDNVFTLINPGTATWDGGYTPSSGDAVYVSNSASLHAFHQFVFSGTEWVHFGGASAIIAGNNISVTGNVWSVQDWSASGTIDAATLQGMSPSAFVSKNWVQANNGSDFSVTPIASGTNSIAIGTDSQATGADSIGLGNFARPFGTESIAIGRNAIANSNLGISLGFNSAALTNAGVAIGPSAIATGTFSVAIGSGAVSPSSGLRIAVNAAATTLDLTSAGRLIIAGSEAQVVLSSYITANLPASQLGGLVFDSTTNQVKSHDGAVWSSVGGSNNWLTANNGSNFITAPVALGTNSISIGQQANCPITSSGSIAIGQTARAIEFNSIAIGTDAATSGFGGNHGIAIGVSSRSNAVNAIAIGRNSVAITDSVSVGRNSTSGTNATALGSYANAATNSIQIKSGSVLGPSIDLNATGRFSLSGSEAQVVLPSYATASLPLSEIGGLAYDSDTDEVKSHDGVQWSAVGSVTSVTPPATMFRKLAGSTATGWLRRGSDLTGNAHSQKFIFSAWVGSTETSTVYWPYTNQFQRFGIRVSTGGLLVRAESSVAGVALEMVSIMDMTNQGGFHILAAVDLSTAIPKTHLYVNDIDVLNSGALIAVQGDTMSMSSTIHTIGAIDGGSQALAGTISEFYLNFSEYLDFSVVGNRRKFISADGKPVDLGGAGATPTGTAPILYLGNPAPSFETNLGTGGDFIIQNGVPLIPDFSFF